MGPFDPGELLLEGDEVLLRPLRIDDAAALAKAASEARDAYAFTPVPDGVEDAERYIREALQQRADGYRYPLTTVWRGDVVGSTSFCDYEVWPWPAGSERAGHGLPDVTEIGFTWLSASAQGTRCNAEAKYLMLRHAFEAWDALRVCFTTDARNARSCRALEKLGARLEGVVRAAKIAADGGVRDSARYSIVRDEWPAIRAGLLERIHTAGAMRR